MLPRKLCLLSLFADAKMIDSSGVQHPYFKEAYPCQSEYLFVIPVKLLMHAPISALARLLRHLHERSSLIPSSRALDRDWTLIEASSLTPRWRHSIFDILSSALCSETLPRRFLDAIGASPSRLPRPCSVKPCPWLQFQAPISSTLSSSLPAGDRDV